MTVRDQPVHYVRPGFILNNIANPIVTRLGLTPTLTVVGRRSGQRHTNPIGEPFVFEGGRYLVSGRGETQWARNLRAAGRCEMRIHRRTERFRVVEITGPDRLRIVYAWRAALGHAVDGYFRQIPDEAEHPVFRLEADA